MNYVVTGGLGFLGQYIVKEILDSDPNCKIMIVSRSRNKHLVVDILNDKKVQFIECDLMIEKKFSFLEGADYVIHNAAVVSFNSKDNGDMYKTNVEATRRLVIECKKRKIKRFVYVSSISAVSPTYIRGKPANETMFQDPKDNRSNSYSKSKSEAEIVLHKMAGNLDYVVGCPSIILGIGDKKINKALRLFRSLPIVPVTDIMISFVDIRDTARAFYFLLKKGRTRQRYIITQDPISLMEFLTMLKKTMKKTKLIVKIPRGLLKLLVYPVSFYERISKNPFITVPKIYSTITDKEYSNNKIKRLGFKFKYSINQTIEEIMKNEGF